MGFKQHQQDNCIGSINTNNHCKGNSKTAMAKAKTAERKHKPAGMSRISLLNGSGLKCVQLLAAKLRFGGKRIRIPVRPPLTRMKNPQGSQEATLAGGATSRSWIGMRSRTTEAWFGQEKRAATFSQDPKSAKACTSPWPYPNCSAKLRRRGGGPTVGASTGTGSSQDGWQTGQP